MNDTACINLLPATRRLARRRQRIAARWLIAVVLISAGTFSPAGAMALGAGSPREETAQRTARAARSLDELRAAEPRLRQKLAELRAQERVIAAVEDRPDWRPVLHAVASVAHGARFDRIDCRIVPGQPPELVVIVTAMVESQTEARRLVLRIEGLGIFESVVLSSENRASLPGGEFVRCEIASRFKLKGVS